MNIRKAVITAAAPQQRTLPLQTLVDRDGLAKPLLRILIEEVLTAGIEEIAVVVQPGDESAYAQAVGERAGLVQFIPQLEARGYGHALYCAREFLREDPFLHLVGDHVYVPTTSDGCARRLVKAAETQACSISAVQATRESLLAQYGAIGGQRLAGEQDLYRVDTVLEKPTPTAAEQQLIVSGLRSGYYLCFFGMHVLTPTVVEILAQQLEQHPIGLSLSTALAVLAKREQYLALEETQRRYNVGGQYGLLTAQLALALSGRDRDFVLSQLLELLAQRQMETGA